MSVVIAKLVPAGLFLSVTLAYALGAVRIVREGAWYSRSMRSIPSATSTCSPDKTGTLAANKLALDESIPLVSPRLIFDWRSAVSASILVGMATVAARGVSWESAGLPGGGALFVERKWSGLVFDSGSETQTCVLGAPEMLGGPVGISPEDLSRITRWSQAGHRVLLRPERQGQSRSTTN